MSSGKNVNNWRHRLREESNCFDTHKFRRRTDTKINAALFGTRRTKGLTQPLSKATGFIGFYRYSPPRRSVQMNSTAWRQNSGSDARLPTRLRCRISRGAAAGGSPIGQRLCEASLIQNSRLPPIDLPLGQRPPPLNIGFTTGEKG